MNLAEYLRKVKGGGAGTILKTFLIFLDTRECDSKERVQVRTSNSKHGSYERLKVTALLNPTIEKLLKVTKVNSKQSNRHLNFQQS